MDKTTDFFDAWLRTQENFTDTWVNHTKRLQQTLLGAAGDISANDPFNLYTSWMTAVLNTLNESRESNIDMARETLSKIFSSSNSYMKLYEIWLPLFKAIQDRTFNKGSFEDFFDPSKYKEVLDKVWGFNPEAMREFYDQAAKLMELLGGASKEFARPWTEAAQKNVTTAPQLLVGNPELLMNIFHNMFGAFNNSIGKVFHVPAVGKDREKIELIMKGFDDLSVYMAKNTEYQHTMYITGQKAMEKVIENMARKITEGNEIKSFNEFFNLWIDVNERTYYALFQTEDFSKLQGELLDSSLNVRRHFFKLMELYLFDFPIALRSEMDDLYKTVYDLKKKVKSLEKELNKSAVQERRI